MKSPHAQQLAKIMKQNINPVAAKADKIQYDKETDELLAYVEGVKAALAQIDKSKPKPMFISDDSRLGFHPTASK